MFSFLTWHDLLFGLTIPGFFALGRMLWTLRTNHLAHIEKALDRIEKKIDDHLIWHAENK